MRGSPKTNGSKSISLTQVLPAPASLWKTASLDVSQVAELRVGFCRAVGGWGVLSHLLSSICPVLLHDKLDRTPCTPAAATSSVSAASKTRSWYVQPRRRGLDGEDGAVSFWMRTWWMAKFRATGNARFAIACLATLRARRLRASLL